MGSAYSLMIVKSLPARTQTWKGMPSEIDYLHTHSVKNFQQQNKNKQFFFRNNQKKTTN